MQKIINYIKKNIKLLLAVTSAILLICGLIFMFTLPIGNFKLEYYYTIYPLSSFMFGGFAYGYEVADHTFEMQPLNVTPQLPITLLGIIEIVLLILSLTVIILILLDKYKNKLCIIMSLTICALSITATVLNFCTPGLLVFEDMRSDYCYTSGPAIILCGIFLSIVIALNAFVFIIEMKKANKNK